MCRLCSISNLLNIAKCLFKVIEPIYVLTKNVQKFLISHHLTNTWEIRLYQSDKNYKRNSLF